MAAAASWGSPVGALRNVAGGAGNAIGGATNNATNGQSSNSNNGSGPTWVSEAAQYIVDAAKNIDAAKNTNAAKNASNDKLDTGAVEYTYKNGDTFGQVLLDLGLSDPEHLWGEDGDVAYYTKQLSSQGINGNVPVGTTISLLPRKRQNAASNGTTYNNFPVSGVNTVVGGTNLA